ncbi:MAG: CRISPR-associated protein Csx3 [Methylococcaceae bacterium]
MIIIDLSSFYTDTAKLKDLDEYEKKALQQAGKGNDITLTGASPVWLYLRIAHVLHGKAKTLYYNSPVTGDLIIFDHNPF